MRLHLILRGRQFRQARLAGFRDFPFVDTEDTRRCVGCFLANGGERTDIGLDMSIVVFISCSYILLVDKQCQKGHTRHQKALALASFEGTSRRAFQPHAGELARSRLSLTV